MMNGRGWIVVALWTVALLSLASAASAKGDPHPDKPRWEFNCVAVRQIVAAHGEAVAELLARRAGVPDAVILRAKACLRK